jgi:DNA-binding NarL/FixJ family response regulator
MTINASLPQTPVLLQPPVAIEPIVRIILADADANFMNSLKDFLMAQPQHHVVARVESCLDALIWCEELSPHVVVLDWHLMFEGLLPAELKGTAFLQKVKALKNPPAVIVASRFSLDDHRATALAAGADGFMPKAKFPQLIRPLIRQLVPQC